MVLEFVSYVTVFLLTLLLVQTIFPYVKQRLYNLPPSPLALPIIGHLHLLSSILHRSFHGLSLRYGPIVYILLGSVPCVVVSSTEIAREFLRDNELSFCSRPQFAAISCLTYGDASFSFSPLGPYWRFLKKLLTTELLANRSLTNFQPVRNREIKHFLELLYEKSKLGEAVNVSEEALKLTSNVVSQMMLSIRCSGMEDEAETARRVVREVTNIFGELNLSDLIWFFKNLDVQGFKKRYEDTHRRYDELLEKIISDRVEVRKQKRRDEQMRGLHEEGEPEKVDLLDKLLDIVEDEKAEMKLTRTNLKAVILDFFTAGTDTTATALEWTLAEMIKSPWVFVKGREEIDKVVGNGRLVQESDVPNLPYIQAIVKESFRLHPPVPLINRMSTENSKAGGYDIPAGTMLFVNIWSIGRDPKYWDDPLEFRPERFLKPKTDVNGSGLMSGLGDVKGQHFELMPFGTGRRACPGMSLALLELTAVIAAVIQCFDWKLAVQPDGGDCMIDMSERAGLTAPRARDLVCVPVARSHTNALLIE
ncbi:Cytochrome P450 [Dillenia turbinata]|uniref:Cytochrome P450 n=1 Tax=Dillenia turbinata TaxID=194707 RepID=A0AAN8VKT7_9MAGN